MKIVEFLLRLWVFLTLMAVPSAIIGLIIIVFTGLPATISFSVGFLISVLIAGFVTLFIENKK